MSRTSPSDEIKGQDADDEITMKALQLLNKKIDAIGDSTTKTMTKTVLLLDELSKKLETIEGRINSSPNLLPVQAQSPKGSMTLRNPGLIEPGLFSPNTTNSTGKMDAKKEKEKEKPKQVKTESRSPSPQRQLRSASMTDLHRHESKPPKEPKVIQVSYKINLISEINAILSTFLIDVKIFFIWTDEACKGLETLKDSEYFGNKKYFDPQIIVTNGHTLEEKSKTVKLQDSKTGEVKVTIHYVGLVYMTSMNLRLFPFDCQNLQLQLKPYKLPIEEVIFEQRPSADSCIEHHVTHEWRLSGHCMKVYKTDPLTSSVGKEYSTVFITVLTQRKSNWFIANIFTPSCILLLLSWLVYTIDPTNIGNRNELALATLTALIANKYVVADQLPKVDYRTMVDVYLDGIFLLQALTTMSNTLISAYQNYPPVNNYFLWKTVTCAAGTVCKKPPSLIFQPIEWLVTLYFDTLNIQFFMLQLVLGLGLHLWMGVTLYDHAMDVEQWIQDAEDSIAQAREEEEEVDHSADFGVTGVGDVPPDATQTLNLGPHHGPMTKSLSSHHGSHHPTKNHHVAVKTPTQRSSLSHNVGTPHRSRRSSFSLATESFLNHENILAIKRWFPDLAAKDTDHFRNFGASTLAAFIGDRDKTLLEEKAYIKRSRALKQELTTGMGEQAGLKFKTELFRKRLATLRSQAASGEKVYDEDIRVMAAVFLQTMWRSNRARKLYLMKKQERNETILEGYARKIQRAYRLRKQYKLLHLSQKQSIENPKSESTTAPLDILNSQTSPEMASRGKERVPMYFPNPQNTSFRSPSPAKSTRGIPTPPISSPVRALADSARNMVNISPRRSGKKLTKENVQSIPRDLPQVPTRRFSIGSMGETESNV